MQLSSEWDQVNLRVDVVFRALLFVMAPSQTVVTLGSHVVFEVQVVQ